MHVCIWLIFVSYAINQIIRKCKEGASPDTYKKVVLLLLSKSISLALSVVTSTVKTIWMLLHQLFRLKILLIRILALSPFFSGLELYPYVFCCPFGLLLNSRLVWEFAKLQHITANENLLFTPPFVDLHTTIFHYFTT